MRGLNDTMNLKGFIVANGVTDLNTDPFIGTVDTAYHFNLMNPRTYKRYKEQACRYYWQEIKVNLPGDCLELLLSLANAFNYTDLYDLRVARDLPLNFRSF